MLGLYFAEFFIHSPVYIKEKEEKEFKQKHDPKNEINIKTDNKAKVDDKSVNNTQDDKEINILVSEDEQETEKQKSILYRINLKLVNNDILCGFLFLFCLIGVNYAIFATYLTNNFEIPLIVQCLFQSFNKIIFVGSLGLMLHLTFLGKLRFLHNILGFGIFTPLARITYAVFLTHSFVQIVFFFIVGTTFYFTFSIEILTVGFSVICYFFAFFISLVYESPVINIMKKFVGGSE